MTHERRIRLTAVMTHPVQYYSPWFRYIAREANEVRLTVLYASEPSPEQQGVGFDAPFTWDVPLRDGYESEVMRPARATYRFDSESFLGLDVPDVGVRIERTEPEVVLLSGWHSITLVRAIAACRRRKIPLLYRGDTHLNGRRSGVLEFWRLRTRWLLARFDRYLSVGRLAREYLRSFGIPDIRVFASPHAVDNELFAREAATFQTPEARSNARRKWGIGADAFVVLFVGKLEHKKRPYDLLKAASLMNEKPVVAVAGSGPLQSELARAGVTLGVPVVWLGFLNQSELGRAYAIADCLALPSDWGETWGLVVNEAMATGLPCVVSERVGCAPDLVIPGETGELFAVGDAAALAAALDRLRDDKRIGRSRDRECRDRVRDFSFENATRGLVDACRSVVS